MMEDQQLGVNPAALYLQADPVTVLHGWQCPICKVVFAPHVRSCSCSIKVPRQWQ